MLFDVFFAHAALSHHCRSCYGLTFWKLVVMSENCGSLSSSPRFNNVSLVISHMSPLRRRQCSMQHMPFLIHRCICVGYWPNHPTLFKYHSWIFWDIWIIQNIISKFPLSSVTCGSFGSSDAICNICWNLCGHGDKSPPYFRAKPWKWAIFECKVLKTSFF